MEPVLIDKRLVNRLSNVATYVAKAYALGQNKKGVVVEALRLPKQGGCETMPGTESTTVAVATANLYSLGLTPCGYARVRKDADSSIYGIPRDIRGYGCGVNAFCITINKRGVDGVQYMSKGSAGMIHNRNFRIIDTRKGVKKNGK